MANIYAKTAAGQQEIETRERRLAPRARSLLILIDGKRSDADLAALVPQFNETLPLLLDAGLVQVLSHTPDKPGGSSAAREAAATSAMPAPARAPAPAPPMVDMAQVRRDAVRAITDLLGPAGDSVTLKLERTNDPAEFRAALERAVTYIANVRGGGAAAQFAARFIKPSAEA